MPAATACRASGALLARLVLSGVARGCQSGAAAVDAPAAAAFPAFGAVFLHASSREFASRPSSPPDSASRGLLPAVCRQQPPSPPAPQSFSWQRTLHTSSRCAAGGAAHAPPPLEGLARVFPELRQELTASHRSGARRRLQRLLDGANAAAAEGSLPPGALNPEDPNHLRRLPQEEVLQAAVDCDLEAWCVCLAQRTCIYVHTFIRTYKHANIHMQPSRKHVASTAPC